MPSFFSSGGAHRATPGGLPGAPRPPPRRYAAPTASSTIRGRQSDRLRARHVRQQEGAGIGLPHPPWSRPTAKPGVTLLPPTSFVASSSSNTGTSAVVAAAAAAARNRRFHSADACARNSVAAMPPPQFSVESGGSALPSVILTKIIAQYPLHAQNP